MVIHETRFYKKLEYWSGKQHKEDLCKLEKLIDSASAKEVDYKKELRKVYREKDFLRTFIYMCELSRQNFGEGREKKTLKNFIMDVIGSVIGDIILETTDIIRLNKILCDLYKRHPVEFTRYRDDRREGRVWILDHMYLNEAIEKELSPNQEEKEKEKYPGYGGLSFRSCVKYDFALFSGISLTEVESLLARGISRTYLHNILYGSIMRRILRDGLKNELYLTGFWDRDLFIGRSDVNHFFDGIIVLEEEDKDNPWLLKSVSTYCNSLDAMESIDAKLDDIGMGKCILFVPLYPSQNALRYSVYAYSEKKHEIMMLYLHDLYEMVEMEGYEIKEHLKGKRIR